MPTIHDAFQPFYRFGKLLGFFCFTFDRRQRNCVKPIGLRDEDMQPRTSSRNVLLLLVNMTFCFWCAYQAKMNEKIISAKYMQSMMLDRSLKFMFTLSFLAGLGTYGLMFSLRYQIAGIVSDLCRVDEELRELGIYVDHLRHRRFLARTCLCVVVTEISLMICTMMTKRVVYNLPDFHAALNVGSYLHTALNYSTMMSAYALSLYAIKLRLRLINEHLRRMPSSVGWHTADRPRNVQRLALVYEQLTEICMNCNRCGSVPALTSVLMAFGYNVICAYTVYRLLGEVTDLMHGVHIAVNIWWNAFFLSFVVVVVYAGSSMTRVARDTGQALHWVLNTLEANEQSAPLFRQLSNFSLQVLHKQPQASCGLFQFDWTLVFSMIATSGTYLVIMIQFDLAMEANRTNGTTL